MRILHRDGAALAVHESGKGAGRPWVFIHGWGCDHTYLAPQQEYFAQVGRTLAMDLRGHGESDTAEGDFSVGSLADDVAWLCRELEVRDPILVGHSMGGIVALDCAARHPALVAGVVLIDSPLLIAPPTLDMTRQVLAALARPDYLSMLPHLAAQFFLPNESERLRARFAASLGNTPQEVLVAALSAHTIGYDASSAAARLRCPTAFIASDRPLADIDRVRAIFPDMTLGQTLGAGHFSLMIVPAQVNAMLQDFGRLFADTRLDDQP